jgi:hypothetical protein
MVTNIVGTDMMAWITGDPRDISHDRFALEACAPKPTNRFKLTKPSIPATHWMDRDEYEEEDKPDPQNKVFEDGFKEQMKIFKKCPEEEKKQTYDLILTQKEAGAKPMSLTDKMFIPGKQVYDATKVYARHLIADYEIGPTVTCPTTGQEIELEGIATVLSWKLCDENTKREIDDLDEGMPKGMTALQAARARKMAAKNAKKQKTTSGKSLP